MEKLECRGKTWLFQHAPGTPDRTSPLPSPAPSQPTDHSLIHKPLAQFVLLLSRLVQRLQAAIGTAPHLLASEAGLIWDGGRHGASQRAGPEGWSDRWREGPPKAAEGHMAGRSTGLPYIALPESMLLPPCHVQTPCLRLRIAHEKNHSDDRGLCIRATLR